MVSDEGIVGLSLAFGSKSPVRTLVQGDGTAMRTTGARFNAELRRNPVLQRAVAHQTHLTMAVVMQLCACNTLHDLQSRLSRWLLMTRDHLPEGDLPLTHALLAEMLGVQRAGVTKAAADLKRRRLISYSRGHIRILDGKGLRRAACSCYAVIRRLGRQRGQT